MATEEKREEEIERLAREVGRLIRESNPETREELREAAAAIMREEAHQSDETNAREGLWARSKSKASRTGRFRSTT
jgi:hypothetical protein